MNEVDEVDAGSKFDNITYRTRNIFLRDTTSGVRTSTLFPPGSILLIIEIFCTRSWVSFIYQSKDNSIMEYLEI